ncbi:MAG: hypothetical protein E6G76_15625 [Alphaproteobacteria bacterium]|nr:MAG: hypothetical protein E6G76_15625 [Alphaproteobacteria bacterium]
MRTADHSHLDDATFFRTRAKEMRALAQEAGALEDRNDILAMAEEYDRLAERIDELAAGQKSAVSPLWLGADVIRFI